MTPRQPRHGASHPCAASQDIAGETAAPPSHQIDAPPVERVEELRREQTLLQTVVDSVDDLIFAKDLQGRFILLNRALREGCGLEVGSRTQDLFEPDLVRGYEGTDHQLVSTGKPVTADEIIPIRGEPRLFQTVKVPWVVDGDLCGVIGVSRDITARQAAEDAVRESEALHRSILEASADCIAVIALDGRLELINEPGRRAMGVGARAFTLGRQWIDLWTNRTKSKVADALDAARAGDAARFSAKRTDSDGIMRWWDVLVTPIKDPEGQVSRLLSICRDVSDSKAASLRLKWSSEHDALTGLANRSAFQARLEAAVKRATRTGASFGLLLLDLDHFKHVNDTLGHAAGDQLLRTVAERLQLGTRPTDVTARLGGDEFAIIVEQTAEEHALQRAGGAMAARLGQPVSIGGRSMSAGVSIGGALFPRDAATALELFNNADTALYALKASGRGGLSMFRHQMRERVERAASQLSVARAALHDHSLLPHYQPKVDLGSGQITGYEALVRWVHPTRGLQGPDTVEEAFKDYELASRIGELVRGSVVADIRGWLDQDVTFGRIAINAAPVEFLRDDYAESLLRQAADAGVPASFLEVEVTEHVFCERGTDYVARALRLLKREGVRIALDDFGTGYSSLAHLRDFPVDLVKIDRSFIQRMADDAEISAIISAVIGLANSLALDVVAEGIETDLQLRILREKGCSHGQGFLFGRAEAREMVGRPGFRMTGLSS
ncbi:EAL domain-containing protein [Sphingomonas yunnanensis]|uniref:putative bifunctional diguanylate cyclase/phosphodiesterase n=1 Tax=Sphingomonas yunnanensis TaxID=310400 RepID=UPI001CA726E7|nr:EAL domain-containing protein [Sphingomonas yunnanensis]MBY9062788.1 EAL domain-containing protein [Sphingomonas yunnanensis]